MVAVTGATGFIGRAVVAALVAGGHRVRALARDLEKAGRALPASDAVEVVTGDALRSDSLAELAHGSSVMMNLVGIRRAMPPEVTFERLHPGVTALAIDAARDAGVRRFVQMSALGTRPAARSAYHKTKYAAEELVRASGLDWTIIRPSVVIGPGGGFLEMAQDWARGDAPPRFFMPYFEPPNPFSNDALPPGVSPRPRMQPVALDDVARAFVAAVERSESIGEVYPLGGPRAYEWPELLAEVRDAMGLKKPVWGIPAPVGEAVARAAMLTRCDRMLPFGLSEVQMSCEENTCTSDRVREDLGLTPGPVALAG